MRDIIHIFCLFAFFLLLAADFPMALAKAPEVPGQRPAFATFVELSPAVHAACLESARTTWQVHSGSRGRPLIGSLDSGIPLLTSFLPQQEEVVFEDVEISSVPISSVDVGVYSLLPATESADNPIFSTRPAVPPNGPDGSDGASVRFPKKDMLSTDCYRKLKEIMQ